MSNRQTDLRFSGNPAAFIPLPDEQQIIDKLEQGRLKLLELIRTGNGPKQNPVAHGDYLYFDFWSIKDDPKSNKYFMVLGPGGVGRTKELLPDGQPPELRFTIAVASDLDALYENVTKYLEGK